MLFQFKTQYGLNIHDAKLPAQSYFESFEERLHNGLLKSKLWLTSVSVEEEREQIASKPEPSTQMGLHLDSTLTLQTKKKYISRVPTDPESFSTYEIQTDDQPLVTRTAPSTWSRQFYADLTKDTFIDFLEQLLSTDNVTP